MRYEITVWNDDMDEGYFWNGDYLFDDNYRVDDWEQWIRVWEKEDCNIILMLEMYEEE